MELTRLSRAVAARWLIVVVISLLGAVGALAFTTFANQELEPLWEAQTALRYEPQEGETVADLADDLDEAQYIATIAAEELLDDEPNSLIVADLGNARLLFVAQGSSAAEAAANSRALLQAFLNVDPTFGRSIDDMLAQLTEEAVLMQTQIDTLMPDLTEDESVVAERNFIEAQINAVNGRLVSLALLSVGNEAEQSVASARSGVAAADLEMQARLRGEAISIEQQLQEQLLTSLEAQKTALGEAPLVELTAEGSLLFQSVEQRMVLIGEEYQRLFLRKLGVTGSETVEPGGLADLTPGPQNPVVNGVLGLVGGLLIAVSAVLFVSRTRGTVWVPEDVGIPILGEIPSRKVSYDASEAWYDTVDAGPRKMAIQALRSAVEAQIPTGGATIAFAGQRVPADGVQALAADLAGSMASTGSSVLLVDASFASRSAMGEFKVGGVSLSSVLALDPDAPDFNAQVRHVVERAYLVRPGLSVVPSGPTPASPGDSLAGRQFRSLLGTAREMYEIVIVVVDDVMTPAAQVAMQRLGFGILVMTPGTTSMPEVNSLLSDFERLKISMLGGVFLGKPGRFVSNRSRDKAHQPAPSGESAGDRPVPEQSPISRLHNYPIPDERRSALVSHESLSQLADQVGAVGDVADLGSDLLVAMASTTPDKAFEAVADYLVTRTEDMVSARYGHGDLSEDLIHQVSEDGFLTLRPLRDRKTVAAWIEFEIEREVDRRTATELIEELDRVLAAGSGRRIRIEPWLIEEFFHRHLTRTDGEPTILHLTSRQGTIALLVPARRLDHARIELLISDVAASEIDELERFRRAAVTRGDLEQADIFEGRIHEVRQFEAALRGLISLAAERGNGGPGPIWSPDWSLGTRANLAPLQHAGLLPFDVLSEEEMAGVVTSA